MRDFSVEINSSTSQSREIIKFSALFFIRHQEAVRRALISSLPPLEVPSPAKFYFSSSPRFSAKIKRRFNPFVVCFFSSECLNYAVMLVILSPSLFSPLPRESAEAPTLASIKQSTFS